MRAETTAEPFPHLRRQPHRPRPDVPVANGQSERPTLGVRVRMPVLADSAIRCPGRTATDQASGPGHSHDPPSRQNVRSGSADGSVGGGDGHDAHVVITMPPTADLVNSVIFAGGVAQALADGAVWVQMGTIGLKATTEIGSRLGQLRPDVMFVDAPVSGSKGPAQSSELLILADFADRDVKAAREPPAPRPERGGAARATHRSG
jgi:hypothetical protein